MAGTVNQGKVQFYPQFLLYMVGEQQQYMLEEKQQVTEEAKETSEACEIRSVAFKYSSSKSSDSAADSEFVERNSLVNGVSKCVREYVERQSHEDLKPPPGTRPHKPPIEPIVPVLRPATPPRQHVSSQLMKQENRWNMTKIIWHQNHKRHQSLNYIPTHSHKRPHLSRPHHNHLSTTKPNLAS